MLFTLPKTPRLKTFNVCTDDHKEFNGVEIVGEPINIGVIKPKAEINKYIIKDRYTYLWELNKLYGGSEYHSIWLLYPKENRPISIEIENYDENEFIDAVQYEKIIKEKRYEESKEEYKKEQAIKELYSKEGFIKYISKQKDRFIEHCEVQELLDEMIEDIQNNY